MNTEIEQYERIQEYLLGRMSDEDRAAFERDLATDDTLREQYEDLRLLARSINRANQEVDMRIALEESEKQLAESSMTAQEEAAIEKELSLVEQELKMMGISVEDPKPSVLQILKDRIIHASESIGQWFLPSGNVSAQSSEGKTVVFDFSYASRMAISFAVAASLALAIILPYNHSVGMSGYNYAPSYIEFPVLRGDNTSMLEKAVNSYNNGDYGQALSFLDETKNSLEATLSQLSDDDSDIVVKLSLQSELYQVEWYRALALMKAKKIKEAKRALRAISKSSNPYAKEALIVIEDVY